MTTIALLDCVPNYVCFALMSIIGRSSSISKTNRPLKMVSGGCEGLSKIAASKCYEDGTFNASCDTVKNAM